MKFSIAISALIAAVAAQDLGSLPACGQTCVSNMLAKAQELECPTATAQCLCANPDFANGLRDCAGESCGADTQSAVVAYGVAYCSSAGVAVAGATVTTTTGTATVTATSTTSVTSTSTTSSSTSTSTDANGSGSSALSSAESSGSSALASASSSVSSALASQSSKISSSLSSASSGSASSSSGMAMATGAPILMGAMGAVAALLI